MVGFTNYLFGVQFAVFDKHREFFTCRFFRRKLDELENKYKIFTWLIDQPAVVYDAKYKRVYASDEQWEEFVKVIWSTQFKI